MQLLFGRIMMFCFHQELKSSHALRSYVRQENRASFFVKFVWQLHYYIIIRPGMNVRHVPTTPKQVILTHKMYCSYELTFYNAVHNSQNRCTNNDERIIGVSVGYFDTLPHIHSRILTRRGIIHNMQYIPSSHSLTLDPKQTDHIIRYPLLFSSKLTT